MAVQEVTAVPQISEKTSGAFRQVFEYHPDMNVTPYLDGREAAGILGRELDSMAHVVEGSLTSDAASATDGIDVLLPFTPKAVWVMNETDSLAYFKLAGMSASLAVKLAAGGVTFPAAGLKMGNDAADNNLAFHIDAAEIAGAGKVIHYVAMG